LVARVFPVLLATCLSSVSLPQPSPLWERVAAGGIWNQ
jgi:hypothetical protein